MHYVFLIMCIRHFLKIQILTNLILTGFDPVLTEVSGIILIHFHGAGSGTQPLSFIIHLFHFLAQCANLIFPLILKSYTVHRFASP